MGSEMSNERVAKGAHDWATLVPDACFFSLLLKQNWALSLSTRFPNHELHAGARSSLMQVPRVASCPPLPP